MVYYCLRRHGFERETTDRVNVFIGTAIRSDTNRQSDGLYCYCCVDGCTP